MPARAETEPNVIPARAIAPPAGFAVAETQPLVLTLGIYAVTFLVPAWPWLTGTVTIPWDAESQFRPQLAFLARALATGQSPFWTPNVFAGWPQISDPQSLIFSPLHFLLALFDHAPSALAFDRVTFALLLLGGGGAGRGARLRVRRFGQCAIAAYEPDHQPVLPAARPLAAGARARPRLVAV